LAGVANGSLNTQDLTNKALGFWHQKVKVVDESDKNLFLLVTQVPYIENKAVAVVIIVLNVLIPGLGTMISSCVSSGPLSKTQLTIGLLQLFTWHALLLGWIWSIYWAYLIGRKAWGPAPMGGMNAPMGVPRKDAMPAGIGGAGAYGSQASYGDFQQPGAPVQANNFSGGAFGPGGAGGPMGPRGGGMQEFA
jgi:hypothetical protein